MIKTGMGQPIPVFYSCWNKDKPLSNRLLILGYLGKVYE